jgi:hypothetical protein
MTLCIVTLRMTINRMTFSNKANFTIAIGRMTITRMTFYIRTINKMTLQNDNQQNNTLELHSAE